MVAMCSKLNYKHIEIVNREGWKPSELTQCRPFKYVGDKRHRTPSSILHSVQANLGHIDTNVLIWIRGSIILINC